MAAYESLKTKEKSSWVIPKVITVAYRIGRLRELFMTKSLFKRGFTKVVITRAGGLREWSQGELWLYFLCVSYRSTRRYTMSVKKTDVKLVSIIRLISYSDITWNWTDLIFNRTVYWWSLRKSHAHLNWDQFKLGVMAIHLVLDSFSVVTVSTCSQFSPFGHPTITIRSSHGQKLHWWLKLQGRVWKQLLLLQTPTIMELQSKHYVVPN